MIELVNSKGIPRLSHPEFESRRRVGAPTDPLCENANAKYSICYSRSLIRSWFVIFDSGFQQQIGRPDNPTFHRRLQLFRHDLRLVPDDFWKQVSRSIRSCCYFWGSEY